MATPGYQEMDMPRLFRTDFRSLLMYLLSAIGGILLLFVFMTLVSTIEALWGF